MLRSKPYRDKVGRRSFALMLARGNGRMRWRAALSLAVLYSICILMPSAALAAANAAPHCFTEKNHQAGHLPGTTGDSHEHADGFKHEHAGTPAHDRDGDARHSHHDGDRKADGGGCCGLFCITAIPHEEPTVLAAPLAARRLPPIL